MVALVLLVSALLLYSSIFWIWWFSAWSIAFSILLILGTICSALAYFSFWNSSSVMFSSFYMTNSHCSVIRPLWKRLKQTFLKYCIFSLEASTSTLRFFSRVFSSCCYAFISVAFLYLF